jgi:hypothetical protein
MAADALLAFKTSTLTKASGGTATTVFGAGTTLAAADAPLNITPQAQLRENGLFAKVFITATGVTGSGTVAFCVQVHASKTVGSGYSVIHSTPIDMTYLTATATTNAFTGKTQFVAYVPLTAPTGFTDSSAVLQDNYQFFQVKIIDTLTTVTAAAATYKVQIVSGKDGGIL